MLSKLDQMERQARKLRAIADDLLIQATEVRTLVGAIVNGGPGALDQALVAIEDEREIMTALLEQARDQAETELTLAAERLSTLMPEPAAEAEPESERETIPSTLSQPGAATEQAAELTGTVRERPLSHPVAVSPSTPPPAKSDEAPVDESEAPAGEGEAPVDEGEAMAGEGEAMADEGEAPADEGEVTGEDLASMLERNTWSVQETPADGSDATAPEDERPARLGGAEFTRPRGGPPRGRGRPVLPAAQARKDRAFEKRSDQDEAGEVSRGSWVPPAAAEARSPVIRKGTGRAPAKEVPEGGLEDLLHGYLKEHE